MIHYLQGQLTEALPTRICVEVHGVGYEVLIPLSSFEKLPPIGSAIRILTHLTIREDAHLLYGFMTENERDLFRLLIGTVSGIGPRTALNILSGMNAQAFRLAVSVGDVRSLSQISGVGKKTAERIVVELKDKMGALPNQAGPAGFAPSLSVEDRKVNDAILALASLGYKHLEAQEMVRGALTLLGSEATVEQIVRACLRKP